MKLTDFDIFPNICTSLKILGVIPSTTCECERPITKMGRILSEKSATMGQERFNSLVLLNVHPDVEISTEKVIDVFAKMKDRRIDL